MKVTYWIADIKRDSVVYSVRAKTRRECTRLRDERGAEDFEKPRKVVIEYADAFDLVCHLMREGGGE